jgi:hypothetical protein
MVALQFARRHLHEGQRAMQASEWQVQRLAAHCSAQQVHEACGQHAQRLGDAALLDGGPGAGSSIEVGHLQQQQQPGAA